MDKRTTKKDKDKDKWKKEKKMRGSTNEKKRKTNMFVLKSVKFLLLDQISLCVSIFLC